MVSNENQTVAEQYRQKGDKLSFGSWETFLVNTMHTKISLQRLLQLLGGSTQALAGFS